MKPKYLFLVATTLFFWSTFSVAMTTTPQSVWLANTHDKSVQPSAIVTIQNDFVETFNEELANNGVIDNSHLLPTIPVQHTFTTIAWGGSYPSVMFSRYAFRIW